MPEPIAHHFPLPPVTTEAVIGFSKRPKSPYPLVTVVVSLRNLQFGGLRTSYELLRQEVPYSLKTFANRR